jgi:hypothetical protein
MAAQQGITPEKFMSDILTEGLYEVYLEFMAQRNDHIRAARPATEPKRAMAMADDPSPHPGGDLDDDVPF